MFNTLFSRAILALKNTASAVCERYGYKLVLQSEYISPEERAELLRKSMQYDDLSKCYGYQLDELVEYQQELRYAQNELEQCRHSMMDVHSLCRQLEKIWLNRHIEKMVLESSRHSAHGEYELFDFDLYRDHLHSSVTRFLNSEGKCLSKEGREYLKQHTGYSADFIPHTEICDETGNMLTIDSIVARSLQ